MNKTINHTANSSKITFVGRNKMCKIFSNVLLLFYVHTYIHARTYIRTTLRKIGSFRQTSIAHLPSATWSDNE